jgi:mycothiol synthase
MAVDLLALSSRPYAGGRELDSVLDLLLACRTGDHRESHPPLSRLRMLLGSRLWEPERDAQVWALEGGEIVGFVGLLQPWRDSPYRQITWFVHPQAEGVGLYSAMLAWALGRTTESINEQGKPIRLSIAVDEYDTETTELLERYAFVRGAVPTLYMMRPITTLQPEPAMPEGFMLRTLPALDELDTYLERYQPLFKRRSLAQRRQLMSSSDYEPGLEMAVETADGILAAFGECSISRREWIQDKPREGWIDYVTTLPEFQRHGLGRALVLTMLQRLRATGAETAWLFVEGTNAPAQQLYATLGFATMRQQVWYGRDIAKAERA